MKKAFTLIELLIAMGMSSMIFMLVSTILVSTLNSNTRDIRQELFEQTKNDISINLSNDVRWAEKTAYSAGDPAVLTLNDGAVVYNVVGGRLQKNGQAITPSSVVITKFTIENYTNVSSPTQLASYQIVIEMEHIKISTAKDQMRIVVSQRKTNQEVTL